MGKNITPKQKKFADAYLKTGNASQAAREAYSVSTPNAAAVQGSRVLRKDNVKEYIEDHVIMARQIISELAQSSQQDAVRLQAAKDILDRAEGKAVQRQINANTDTEKTYGWAE